MNIQGSKETSIGHTLANRVLAELQSARDVYDRYWVRLLFEQDPVPEPGELRADIAGAIKAQFSLALGHVKLATDKGTFNALETLVSSVDWHIVADAYIDEIRSEMEA